MQISALIFLNKLVQVRLKWKLTDSMEYFNYRTKLVTPFKEIVKQIRLALNNTLRPCEAFADSKLN